MRYEPFESEDDMRQAVGRTLDAGPIPAQVQARLDDAYASLESIPQDRTRIGGRTVRRGVVVAVAAVLVVLLSGTAFAVSRLIQMQPGEASFFSGSNLPVYDSLKDGVSSLTAEVGQTAEAGGVSVTLDSVSCDRNIVNLFFTLKKEGGFDLDAQSLEGSRVNEWTRLQSLAPHISYTLASNGEKLGSGSTSVLDAYREGDAIKVMERIVPERTLPDQVDITLEGWNLEGTATSDDPQDYTLEAGLDLSTVAQPRELGSQDLVFSTSEGDKTIGIERFTASELGTVMVARNDEIETFEPDGRPMYNLSDSSLALSMLKVTDDHGNVLVPVSAGDGLGIDLSAPYVVEYANLSPEAESVTFEAMVPASDAQSDEGESEQHVDVSKIGTKLPTSEYGGFELTGWDVKDSTVTITLKPYGWQSMGQIELIPVGDVTKLKNAWTNPSTGESGVGYQTSMGSTKQDYLTGELMQITSYYAADDEELRGLKEYFYYAPISMHVEEGGSTHTLAFNA